MSERVMGINDRLSDESDLATMREMMEQESSLRAVQLLAAQIPPGEPGECDLCGEWSGRLVSGVCAPCRDRHRLP